MSPDPSLSLNIILLCVIRIYAEVPVWNSKENGTNLPSKLDKSEIILIDDFLVMSLLYDSLIIIKVHLLLLY